MKKFIIGTIMSIVVLLAATTTVSASSYTVNKGDNLWTIAMENNTTMQNLMEINGLDSTLIHPNQVITLAEKTEQVEQYEVKKGDTLSHIGKEFGVTVDQLKQWNELKSSLILIGQKLTIKEGRVTESQSKPVNQSAQPTPKVPKAPVEKKAEQPAQQEAKQPVEKKEEVSGKTISVKATAYTAKCEGCSGITYTGIDLNKDPNAKVIAVDPSVIPLGTKVYVEGYGHAIAGDIGGAIKGNRIDIHVPTKQEAYSWGVRNVNVTIIE